MNNNDRDRNNDSNSVGNDSNNDSNSVVSTTSGLVKIQTDVSRDTKTCLRVEAIRRGITMGQLIDELVKLLSGVSEKTS